ncbi:MAG: hypothetical protein ACFFD4_37375, partial [Candidatus Odinarchaeota archaeon]
MIVDDLECGPERNFLKEEPDGNFLVYLQQKREKKVFPFVKSRFEIITVFIILFGLIICVAVFYLFIGLFSFLLVSAGYDYMLELFKDFANFALTSTANLGSTEVLLFSMIILAAVLAVTVFILLSYYFLLIGLSFVNKLFANKSKPSDEGKYLEKFLNSVIKDKDDLEKVTTKKTRNSLVIFKLVRFYTFLDPYKVYCAFKGNVNVHKARLRLVLLLFSISLLLFISGQVLDFIIQLTGDNTGNTGNPGMGISIIIIFALITMFLIIRIIVDYYRYHKGFVLFIDEIAKKLEHRILALSLALKN